MASVLSIRSEIEKLQNKYCKTVLLFANYVCSNYSIVEKGDWAANASIITNEVFDGKIKEYNIVIPNINNLGFWFRPETIMPIFLIKNVLNKIKNYISFI